MHSILAYLRNPPTHGKTKLLFKEAPEKIGTALAREKLRLPTESETGDRSVEYLHLGTVILFLAIIAVFWAHFGFMAENLFFIAPPLIFLALWYSARRKRLEKARQRAEFFQAAAASEILNSE